MTMTQSASLASLASVDVVYDNVLTDRQGTHVGFRRTVLKQFMAVQHRDELSEQLG